MKTYKLSILVILLKSLLCGVLCKSYVVTTFTNLNKSETLSHMTQDSASGKLFLAATNNLYRLTPDLKLEQHVRTGPREDNPACLPPQSGTGFTNCKGLKPMNSYNKILVLEDAIKPEDKRLIVCSTLYHGYCEKRHLNDISAHDPISYRPVVANNKTATTVAFIGPGPYSQGLGANSFYVAASWTITGVAGVRDLVPAFSSRRLDNFALTQQGIFKSSKEIEVQHRQSFPVYYIHGFSSNSFSYIVTVQKSSTLAEAPYISKLIRVCQQDEKFNSYAEVELRCTHNGARYNLAQTAYVAKPGTILATTLNINPNEDVLYAVFTMGSPQSVNTAHDSALCIYPMRDIREIFTRNIQNCFKGIGNTGPDHIIRPAGCRKSGFLKDIDDNYCGIHEFNMPINGQDPIETTAALTLNLSVVAITVTTTHKYTVAFLGTQNGHLIKVALESRTMAHAYEDIVVDEGRPIHMDMYFDSEKENIFVFNDLMVYKVAVQDCNQYKTCGTCRGAKDPYCGWCSLEDKCSLRNECSKHELHLRWLEYSGSTCSNITQVYPDKIQKKISKTTLTLNISNLPSFVGKYKCSFTGHGRSLTTEANLRNNSNVIICDTPLPHTLPPFPTGEDHIVMKLAVQMNDKDFVSTNFTFFDCEVHTKNSCYDCTASQFNCTWCIKNHLCTHYPLQECTSNDEFVSGKNSLGLQVPHQPGPSFCPYFQSSVNEILVHSKTTKKVTLTGHNIRDFQNNLQCIFNLGGEQKVTAQVTDHTPNVKIIECGQFYFQYKDETKFWNVPFKVVWGGNKPIDNPSNIQVKMYKCENMAQSCGECLVMDSNYKCGWCNDKKVCNINRECLMAGWLSNAQTCPNPYISRIYPLTGVKKGGTELTIEGRDLGKIFADIVSNVDVIGIQCTPLRIKYKPASRIVCQTGEYLNNDGKASGPVRVTVNSEYPTESAEHFSYVDPELNNIYPSSGPMAGGTVVTITGRFMNAGTHIRAYFGVNECTMISKSRTRYVCSTSAAASVQKDAVVRMEFDKQEVSSTLTFTYDINPDIDSVYPLKAIRSGGIVITVKGSNLESIHDPKMVIWSGSKSFEGDCTKPTSPDEFSCLSPMIDTALIPQRKEGATFYYGFRLDNVVELMNLTKKNARIFKNFTIYPDPILDMFPGETLSIRRKNDEQFVTISGKFILEGIQQKDVIVRVGKGYCNVTSVGSQITCKPPKSQPKSLQGNRYPEVQVIVGENLTIFIGFLKYEEAEFPLPLEYIILIAALVGVLLICVIVVIIMYRCKSKKNDSMMKKMQIQMDNLEAKVAKECKEAFAELQTDMTELTSDLYGQVAIPFWDYRTYCMRVLFPKQEQEQEMDHPVIRDLEVDYARRESVEKGLKLFAQMLNNKTFLLIFVRTLEGHKGFNMRDRVNVASLISVALQTKMEYATDILKTLLAELIEKSVEGKNHPKLLLRRTESVAEKMLTNWFTFLLYKFLRECAGEPLFMLYQAVKQQVSKGPVDNATSEARYSLSEDKLIRQQIEFRQMTIYVQDMDQFGQSPHPVKVLDCDTISQVKEKILDAIYKSAPFSSRPVKDDIDLVLFDKSSPDWSSGVKGRLILQDDDISTKPEGEYKRLNSLAHYKVPDGAYMTLVPKQPQSYYNMSLHSNDKSGSKLYGDLNMYTRSPSLNRTLSPQGVHLHMEGDGNFKYYHLVKQHDAETLKEGDRSSKMVSEIYLTRLLATKGTLQQFVDDLFERIFSTAHRGTALPLAIKYMFDFLDDQALQHGIQDSEVVHTWKSNSLPLRFWVNVIKNPNFVFDIYKSPIVDSCLSVVAQTFMDSCSMSDHRLSKDSPSSKLLYAKDIPKYKKWVERYYQDIKMMPAISDQDMTAMMTEESRSHQDEYNTSAALLELYKYVQKYNEELWQALDEDEFAKKNRLTYKLEQVRLTMEAEVYC